MKRGHGRLVMAVMALVMAVMATVACSVEWSGVPTVSPSMTEAEPSMTNTPLPSPTLDPSCPAHVRAAKGGDGALNLREKPSTSARVLLILADGEALSVVGGAGGWYEVRVTRDGTTLHGWVRADYVEACQ